MIPETPQLTQFHILSSLSEPLTLTSSPFAIHTFAHQTRAHLLTQLYAHAPEMLKHGLHVRLEYLLQNGDGTWRISEKRSEVIGVSVDGQPKDTKSDPFVQRSRTGIVGSSRRDHGYENSRKGMYSEKW